MTEPKAGAYSLSGRPGLGLIVLPAVAVFCGGVTGWLYGIVNVWNPLIYIQFLATFCGAGALGWIIDQAAGLAKCRNKMLVYAAGVLCGVTFFYFSWASFLCMLAPPVSGLPGTTFGVAADPGVMWSAASAVANTGWFTIGRSGSNVSGIALWGIWLVEAGMLLGVPLFVAWKAYAKRTYCEDCGCWVKASKGLHHILVNPDTTEMAKNCDLDGLAEAPLGLSAPLPNHYFRVDHSLCERCQNTGTCCVMEVEVTKSEDDKDQVEETNASGFVILTPEKAQQLGRMVARIKQRAQEIREKRKADAQEALKARQAKAANAGNASGKPK
jgi:hypothetical protein